jgi:TetR/AcrR family transcriptional repressor of lmrAB and yxaGH operons
MQSSDRSSASTRARTHAQAAAATKKAEVISATLRLLRTSGLGGASLNRTLEQSGAPKGSLYHYFPGGKPDLVKAALERFGDDFAALLAAHWSNHRPFATRLRALVGSLSRGMRREDFALGCPAAAALLDLEADEREIRDVARATLDRWIQLLAQHLPALPVARRRPFAETLFATLEGALILSRAQRDELPLTRAADFCIAAHDRLARGRRRT